MCFIFILWEMGIEWLSIEGYFFCGENDGEF